MALVKNISVTNQSGVTANFNIGVELANVEGLETALSGKVDVVAGKGLSTNDYTDTEKTKLNGIAEGADANVQSDQNETDTTSDAYIANKPALGTAAYTASTDYAAAAHNQASSTITAMTGYEKASSASAISASDSLNVAIGKLEKGIESADISIATTSVAGKVKPDGTTITITADGTISAVGGGSGDVKLGDVSGATMSTYHKSASLTQTDPEDLVVSGVAIAQWAGTKIVRKAGSAPTSVTDGVLVADVTTRNQYSSTPLVDEVETGKDQNTLYYYRFFPYTIEGTVTLGTSVTGTFTREVVPLPTPKRDYYFYTGQEVIAEFNNYNSDIMSVSGNTATNIGTYTAVFTITNNNYIFSDSTFTTNVEQNIDQVSIVTQADGTDSEIKAMLDAYYEDVISWSDMGQAVGDTRLGHFNSMAAPTPYLNTWPAQDITLIIVDYEHTDLATSINGHTKACITVQTREIMNINNSRAGTIYVNGDSSYDMSFTKQSNLYMRTYLNNTVLDAIPEGNFKSAIKQSSHYRHTYYSDSTSEQVIDTLFLPSYPEVFGTTSSYYYTATNPTEGTQFKYYETSTNRVKYINNNGSSSGSAYYQQLGSPSPSSSGTYGFYWCEASYRGEPAQRDGGQDKGLAPTQAM